MTKTKSELRVLLVEDNPSDVYLVRELLNLCEKRKYGIEETNSLSGAIGQLEKFQYDAILLDLSLPDSIGLPTFDKIRLVANDTPIVVCSGTSDLEFATKAVQHGAQDYVVKGKFDQDVLSRAIEYAIERQALLLQLRIKNEELEKSESQLRSIIENNADGMMILSPEGHVRFANPAAGSLFNVPASELIEKIYPELIAEREQMDYDLSDLCGRERYVEVRTELIIWEGEASLLASLRDITQRKKDEAERRKMSEQLFQAQKMEAIGTLAGGVAHDFNNIMGITMMASSNAMARATDPKLKHDLKIILDAAERGAAIAKQLLVFARSTDTDIQPLQVGTIVKQVRKMLETTMPKNISVETKVDAINEWINGDQCQLYQVLLNLAINAKDAMPDGGLLTIEVLNEKGRGAIDEFVVIKVTDTGTGIPGAIIQRVFDPFFTTKEIDKGTGLGLSIVHGVIKNHGGHVKVESKLGQGASFKIYLPAIKYSAAIDKQADDEHTDSVGGSEWILVVDDEEMLRQVLVKALSAYGYSVLEAENGAEALSIYEKNTDKLHLVITDIDMPRMSGEDLCLKIKDRNPQSKVIVETGHTDRDVRDRMLSLGVQGFIQKPFSLEEILKTVRQVLDMSA